MTAHGTRCDILRYLLKRRGRAVSVDEDGQRAGIEMVEVEV